MNATMRLGRPRPPMTKVDQTILLADPERLGNCVAASVATILGEPLEHVPHFVELGVQLGDAKEVDAVTTGHHWWAMLLGFLWGQGLWVEQLDDISEASSDDVLLVAGMTERGVMHQVVYVGQQLWHDPHPSHAGLTEVREVLAVRAHPTFDHTPSPALEETRS